MSSCPIYRFRVYLSHFATESPGLKIIILVACFTSVQMRPNKFQKTASRKQDTSSCVTRREQDHTSCRGSVFDSWMSLSLLILRLLRRLIRNFSPPPPFSPSFQAFDCFLCLSRGQSDLEQCLNQKFQLSNINFVSVAPVRGTGRFEKEVSMP